MVRWRPRAESVTGGVEVVILMVTLIPLFILLGFALHVAVLQLGAPMVGADRPHLGRTVVTCLVAPLFGMLFSMVVGLPLSCLFSSFGTAATVGLGLLVGILVRGVLYAFLLGFKPTQAGVLAVVGSLCGWTLYGGFALVLKAQGGLQSVIDWMPGLVG